MIKILFTSALLVFPSLALAREPVRFVSLDGNKRIWVVDVVGRHACPAAAALLARERHLRLDRVFPTLDGDLDYRNGCIALLK